MHALDQLQRTKSLYFSLRNSRITESQNDKRLFRIYWKTMAEANRIAYAQCLWLEAKRKQVDSTPMPVDARLECYDRLNAILAKV